MSVTNVHKDLDALTLTMTAEFAAPIERVWQLWEDPRLLEQWWGPPEYPAKFIEHRLVAGGRSHYAMTGPGGEEFHGCWSIVAVDPPSSLELDDAFADTDGNPSPELPVTRMRVTLTPLGDGTRMHTVSTYASRDDLEKVIEMGVEEGMVAAVNQIDGILAATAEAPT